MTGSSPGGTKRVGGSSTGPAARPAPRRALGLWKGYGVEIEMMIVDAESLDVRPVADRLFELQGWSPGSGGDGADEMDHADRADHPEHPDRADHPDHPDHADQADGIGDGNGSAPQIEAASDLTVEGVGWSNEVALHVLELKTPGPVPSLEGVARTFQRSVDRANTVLEELGCRLLPGGMHPWMDPEKESRIWPHEYTEVYHTFDRIFGCRGHGWSNLQSTHVNLPFADDREFGLLHEAVRRVLPLIPALAASSPVLDGRVGPALDSRIVAYRGHARQVPSVTGAVVPEPVRSEAEYRTRILEPIYADLASLDREGVLHHEWVNARGAIARFSRGSVEVRVIDAQESPRMDLAVAAAVTAAVRRVTEVLETEGEGDEAASPSTGDLAVLLDDTARSGGRATLDAVSRHDYRRILDLPGTPASVGDVWEGFLEGSVLAPEAGTEWGDALGVILREGTLSERLLSDLGVDDPGSAGREIPPSRLRATYGRLADTLAEGGTFRS